MVYKISLEAIPKKSFKNVLSNTSVTTVSTWLPMGTILNDNTISYLILSYDRFVLDNITLRKFVRCVGGLETLLIL